MRKYLFFIDWGIWFVKFGVYIIIDCLLNLVNDERDLIDIFNEM